MTQPPDDSAMLPVAFLNGTLVPFHEARLPVYDLGIVQAATVTERLRTIRHRPYLVREHLQRLTRSLEMIGCNDPRIPMNSLAEMIDEIARRNSSLITPGADLSIVIFITAGQALGDANGLLAESRPTVCLYSAPLPLAAWAKSHRQGLRLVTPSIRQLPGDLIHPHIKHRSRLHWFLADQQARQQDSSSMALLLDNRGAVTETSSGNLCLLRANELLTPRIETTLPGIAQAHVLQLAEAAGWEVRRADLSVDDVAQADEAFLTSSTYCILPVAAINGLPVGAGIPGPGTRRLMDKWGEEMGLDFAQQAIDACG